MKTIKFILLSTALAVVIDVSAQYSYTFPYSTPNCNPVTVLSFIGTDYTTMQKNDLKNFWLNDYSYRITFEADATYTYNCHAYAWAGSTQVWMNKPEETKYWSDGSYILLPSSSTATKVWFGVNDHSAITTNTTNYFSSKWGPSPRFTHLINDCPYYDSNQITYYKKASPPPFYISITGNDWCNHGTIYTNSSGYASTNLYAYSPQSSPTSYVWTAGWDGICNSWSMMPYGNRVDITVTINSGQPGGTLDITCEMYNGSTFLGTTTYSLNVFP